jgi:hypothetical protein
MSEIEKQYRGLIQYIQTAKKEEENTSLKKEKKTKQTQTNLSLVQSLKPIICKILNLSLIKKLNS